MCLVLKLLQIQPDLDIVYEFISNSDYKYVRALGAFYLRMVGRPVDIHQVRDARIGLLRSCPGSGSHRQSPPRSVWNLCTRTTGSYARGVFQDGA